MLCFLLSDVLPGLYYNHLWLLYAFGAFGIHFCLLWLKSMLYYYQVTDLVINKCPLSQYLYFEHILRTSFAVYFSRYPFALWNTIRWVLNFYIFSWIWAVSIAQANVVQVPERLDTTVQFLFHPATSISSHIIDIDQVPLACHSISFTMFDSQCGILWIQMMSFSIHFSSHYSGASTSWFQLSIFVLVSELCRLFRCFLAKSKIPSCFWV